MDSSLLKVVTLFAIASAILIVVGADESSSNNVECVNQLVKWCEARDYKHQIRSKVRTTTLDPETGKYQKIMCKSNKKGSKCKKDGSSWLSCSADHMVNYKGTVLHKDSTSGADSEICTTAQKARKSYLDNVRDPSHGSSAKDEEAAGVKSLMDVIRRGMDHANKQMFNM